MQRIRNSFLTLAVGAGLLLGASIAVTPATAAPITFSFTGDVVTVDPLLASQFLTSQTMSGTMTVSQTDTNGSSTIGNYAIQSFEVNIGTYDLHIGTSGQVQIVNGTPGLDRFGVQENGPFTTSATVNFLAPKQFEITLRSTLDLFPNDALPTSIPPPSISDFNNSKAWRLDFGPSGGVFVAGAITSLTAVPLPPAVILFGAGLVALIGLGARNWQRDARARIA